MEACTCLLTTCSRLVALIAHAQLKDKSKVTSYKPGQQLEVAEIFKVGRALGLLGRAAELRAPQLLEQCSWQRGMQCP